MTTRRKKPRLFSFSREVEIANFEEVVTDPHERRVLEGMVDGFLEICRTQAVSAETLGAVASAARHPSPYVRGVGITRLTVLAHWFEPAIAVVSSLLDDEDEGLRVFVTAALPNTPDALAIPLLDRALSDVSWRVRKTAAQACSAFPAAALVPVLERCLARETDARVRVQLTLARDFQARGPAAP
jgi:hypothetical protein